MRLLVIDGNSIANRAFYGIKLLTTKDGRYTNAIYGFLNILLSLLKECQPDEVAVAFDLKAPTFRHKMYDGYKATRHAMPEELAQQMPVLKQLLADLGYRTVTAEGWEADDILGTLAAACAARKDDCFLATGDRDSLQLVSESTTVLLAATVMGRSKTVVMDEDAIQEKYGLAPKQLIEVKSLMGDTSDNIPGVKGIGEKTAEKAKMEIANVFDPTGEKKMTIRGRNLLKGLPESIEISDQDIYDAIHENAMEIVEQVKLVLESTPPELVGDILSNGILLTGGGAMLGGLPELISDNVGAPCFVAENPIECVARGVDAAFKMSGELLDGFEQIQLYNFK